MGRVPHLPQNRTSTADGLDCSEIVTKNRIQANDPAIICYIN